MACGWRPSCKLRTGGVLVASSRRRRLPPQQASGAHTLTTSAPRLTRTQSPPRHVTAPTPLPRSASTHSLVGDGVGHDRVRQRLALLTVHTDEERGQRGVLGGDGGAGLARGLLVQAHVQAAGVGVGVGVGVLHS